MRHIYLHDVKRNSEYKHSEITNCMMYKNLALYFRVDFCHYVLHFLSFKHNKIFNITTQEHHSWLIKNCEKSYECLYMCIEISKSVTDTDTANVF